MDAFAMKVVDSSHRLLAVLRARRGTTFAWTAVGPNDPHRVGRKEEIRGGGPPTTRITMGGSYQRTIENPSGQAES